MTRRRIPALTPSVLYHAGELGFTVMQFRLSLDNDRRTPLTDEERVLLEPLAEEVYSLLVTMGRLGVKTPLDRLGPG